MRQLVNQDETFDADGEHTPESAAWEELLDQVAEHRPGNQRIPDIGIADNLVTGKG